MVDHLNFFTNIPAFLLLPLDDISKSIASSGSFFLRGMITEDSQDIKNKHLFSIDRHYNLDATQFLHKKLKKYQFIISFSWFGSTGISLELFPSIKKVYVETSTSLSLIFQTSSFVFFTV